MTDQPDHGGEGRELLTANLLHALEPILVDNGVGAGKEDWEAVHGYVAALRGELDEDFFAPPDIDAAREVDVTLTEQEIVDTLYPSTYDDADIHARVRKKLLAALDHSVTEGEGKDG